MSEARHRSRATLTWAVLMVLTVASYSVSDNPAIIRAGATAIVLIAAVKIHLVVSEFMELRWAHQPWRLLLSVWTVIATAIVLGGYWFAVAGTFA